MKKILFVCMGNICRSPSAEGVMNRLIQDENLGDSFACDSAGTIGYHEGELPDARMRKHAKRRGVDLTSYSRRFNNPEDFEKFDLVVVMDDRNLKDVLSFDHQDKYRDKVVKMTDFCENRSETEVPDPYYGGPEGFDTVLDIVEDGCRGLLEQLKKNEGLDLSVANM